MVASGRSSDLDGVKVVAPIEDRGHNAHRIRTETILIDGKKTDFILQPFSDRIFMIVTQFEKMGTIVMVSVDVTLAGAESFATQVLMGKRDVPEIELCARNIMGFMKADGCTKPLLLSLALKDHSISVIRAVVEQVRQMRVW